ncbi:MAG: PocR ligand-binding domain-containing protein, partial [Xanthomonadales bacterium]|nr:PocR ligand-binding domain-containing protein [Xanthomonadales bacterium]
MNRSVTSSARPGYEDLVAIPLLENLLEQLNRVTGVANAVGDLEGKLITRAGWLPVCSKYHRANPETCQRCQQSVTSLASSMTRGEPYAVYQCLNGLTESAAPIMVGGQHLANIFTGQFLTEPPDMDFFRSQAKQFDFDEQDYLAAVRQVPVIPAAQVEAITQLNAKLAAMLASSGLDRLTLMQTNEDLASLNEEFEAKVADRTAELSLMKERLQLALDAARQAAFDLNIPTGEVVTSPQYARLLGFNPAEFDTDFHNWLDNIHPDDRSALMVVFKRALKTDEALEMTYRRRTKSGGWIWINSRGKV